MPVCGRWIREGFFPGQEIEPAPLEPLYRSGSAASHAGRGGGRSASSKSKMKKPAAVRKALKKPAAK